MQFQALWCSGSIGNGHNNTSFLIDDDILIDAGSGLGTLSLDAMCKIDHVFLSHSHIDHVALLPLLADATLSLRSKPIVVHATKPTLDSLSDHVFNWEVYPDFREIISDGHPAVNFSVIEPNKPVSIGGRHLTGIPVEHTVPTVAYHLAGGDGSLVVATDMTISDKFWPVVNAIDDLRYLLIETAFQNARADLCAITGHLCPTLLGEELQRLERPVEIYVTHMKPSAKEQIRREIGELPANLDLHILSSSDILEI